MDAKKLLRILNEDVPPKPNGDILQQQFWVLTQPTKVSELDDIFFKATLYQLFLQLKGGLSMNDIVGVFPLSETTKARALAQFLLDKKQGRK